MNWKAAVVRWSPPALLQIANVLRGQQPIRFCGPYRSWDEAARAADGYGSDVIFQRVLESARMARDGRAAFERDGVAFADPQAPMHLLAALWRAASLAGNRLRVLDFGGSLGSTYFQCRPYLAGLAELQWHIVEQPEFVRLGRAEFATDTLRFHATTSDCLAQSPIDLALFSGVLHYLPDPIAILAEIADSPIRWLVIDRHPQICTPDELFVVQRVPAAIYGRPVTYPARLYSANKLSALLSLWRAVWSGPTIDTSMEGPYGLVPHTCLLYGRSS